MSSSPTRQHNDFKPAGRPESPPTPAELRSQAIAKLKRAASLPRNRDGRRPLPSVPNHEDANLPQPVENLRGAMESEPEQEEVLSPSPSSQSFDHTAMYGNAPMQRSASQSSDYRLPTAQGMGYIPSSANTPYGYSPGLSPIHPSQNHDWAAMQLAQSYLPSLSPATLSPSPFGSRQHSSRNTPSPLPTLGDLATLSRSNSQAARARAMDKLTGGRDPSPIPPPVAQDDLTVKPNRAGRLQRSGTVGARMFNIPSTNTIVPEVPKSQGETVAEPVRPRLQRSFTVSSTNMGEERRSAVGRRMVERLAERRAAREKEEAEVRQLWEERRAIADQSQGVEAEDAEEETDEPSDLPAVHRHSPAEPPAERLGPGVSFGHTEMLGVPDRPVSRETMRSNGGPFEYEMHLRRSLSSRTARGAVGVTSDTEPDSVPPSQGSDVEQLDRYDDDASADEQEYTGDLAPPRAAFATPSGHVTQSSTSTNGTVHGDRSPGSDSNQSRDGLQSMTFVMGHASHGGQTPGRQGGSWPTGVEDQGSSDWGTPSRRLDDPQTPRRTDNAQRSTLSSAVVSDDEESNQAMRQSGMSWTEVGGPADLEIPSDAQYHKKSGSVSAKFGRSVKTALRRGSQSRYSGDSSSPNIVGEVFTQVKQTFSRRGSQSSTSPKGMGNSQMSHQPSISSLSPSLTRSDSVSNVALLQHEGPNREWMPPRADPDDPRIVSSKMSPFPGMAALEDKSRQLEALGPPPAPRLIHQASDSVVPTQQRTQVAEQIYALPLPALEDAPPPATDESTKKRSWLAKTFSSRRSSGSPSRRSSTQEPSLMIDDGQQPSPILHADAFSPTPLPAPIAMRKMSASRPGRASPAVSVVPGGSEDGSRLTRYTTPIPRLDNTVPSISEDGVQGSKSALAHQKLNEMIAMGPDDPSRPEMLDDPPRKLLLSTQVLQVINANTAKDRYLFLFNDILVIAKPLITQGNQATLDMQYIVKSIVPLDASIRVSGFMEPEEPKRTESFDDFIADFAVDAIEAFQHFPERFGVKVDATTIASLLYNTPEFDRAQIGKMLCGDDKLKAAFLDRFNFTGVPIDEALRIFLLSLRLPSDSSASQGLLQAFAHQYQQVNQHLLPYNGRTAYELVASIIQLNDALYGSFGRTSVNKAITLEVYIKAFQLKDPHSQVSKTLLAEIYNSLRSNALVHGLSPGEPEFEVSVSCSTKMLTYDMWSERIYISIPDPDPAFQVNLHGDGLVFDPPSLNFASSAEQSFRVKGINLGPKSMFFARLGANAARYSRLGNGRNFLVERAYMQHTFKVSFLDPSNSRRNYCFSVPTGETKSKWAQLLQRQIGVHRVRAQSASANQLRQVAEQASLQVLRDAVISLDHTKHQNASRSGHTPETHRRGSVSTTYDQLAGRDERALGPLQPPKVGSSSEKQPGLLGVQTGKELVLLCRQNSLMPGMLELLSAARDDIVARSEREREPPKSTRPNGHRGLGVGGSISEGKRTIMTGRF